MTYAIVAVAITALVYTIYMIIREFSRSFDRSEAQKDATIKDLSSKNEPQTPKQLVDFFNRPNT